MNYVHRISNQNISDSKNEMVTYFSTWKNSYAELLRISPNAPILKNVLPYAARVSDISGLFEIGLKNGKLSKKEFDKVMTLLEAKEDPLQNLDVDFAVTESLKQLAEYLVKQ